VDKISCKCEGNVFQKKRLIVTKKQTSPFSSFKSLLVTRKLHLLRNLVRDDATPFVNTSNLSFQNTVSFVGHDDKTFFSTHGKMKTGFFSYFLNGW